MGPTQGWQNEGNARQHGIGITLNNEFKFIAEIRTRIPARCLNYVTNVAPPSVTSVLDIGCAAGDLYAYMISQPASRKFEYEGVDISKPAIDAANRHYQTDRFSAIGGDEDLAGKSAGIVVSLNVLPNHPKPLDHLDQILKCTGHYLVAHLRTRDNGETILDPELSCMRLFGEWFPFFVINIKEIYRKILASAMAPVRISCFKEYMMLAGSGPRFLPKELFEEDAKTASTTLVVEKQADGVASEIIEYHNTGNPSGPVTRMILWRIGHYTGKLGLEKFAAGFLNERITDINGVLKYGTVTATKHIDIKECVG